MPLVQKPFADIVTFSRASGATRVNAAGLIVGVDFSATSVTIGTGAKTFTLAATANVNRDWPVGSAVRAVDQVGGGAMIGTVTSYSPVTQELVINVTSITGSGTSTNWRIGSLEFRRDFDPVTLAPRGGLVEGQATNSCLYSEDQGNDFWLKTGVVISLNASQAPDGSITADKITRSGAGGTYRSLFVTTPTAGLNTFSIYVKPAETSSFSFFAVGGLSGTFNLQTLTAPENGSIQPVGNGFFRCSFRNIASGAAVSTGINVIGNDGEGLFVWGAQLEAGSSTSYIPTTTVAVTRAADLPNVDGQRLLDFYNNEGGVLYVEATPLAAAVSAVAASLNDGTMNNAIRIGQKQSGTLSSIRAIASDGVTDVMAVNATTGNTLRSNGIDYSEVSDGGGVGKLGVATSATGAFLNVGGSENIRNSADSGLTYNARTIGGTLAGAHFGIGRFVIAGSTSTINGATTGSVIVSTDGITFRRVNIPGLTQNLNEVTSNGTNQYVAVGSGGVIYTSPDAEVWTAQVSGSAGTLVGVHYFGGRYVATVANAAQVRYSDDGVNWLGGTGNNSTGYLDVYHNGTDLWVCAGVAGAISTSPDGITWTPRTSGVTTQLNGIHFADGLWVAVGNAGTVVTSPDGITWTDRTATSGNTQNNTEVYFFSGFWYNIGASGLVRRITTTDLTNNVTWSAVTLPALAGALIGIVANGTRLLVCGTNGAIVTSDDGTTFTSRTGNTTTLNGAAFGAGTYVVVGNAVNGSGLIATVDPTTFAYTRQVSGTTQNIINVVFSNGMFFALSIGTQGIITSTDGINWTPRTTSNSAFYGLAYSGTTYVAAANGGDINTSSNGTTWTLVPDIIPGFTGSWLGCVYKSGLFVIVGQQGRIATSPDGTTWTSRTSGTTQALYAANYSTRDQCFYAAGDGGVILRSADGITWENIANDAVTAIIKAGQIKANPNPGNWVPGQVNRVVTRFSASGMASSINGGAVASDSSVEVIVPNRLSLGMDGASAQHFNGHLRRIGYRTDAISDANLVEVSAGNVDFFTASQGGLA